MADKKLSISQFFAMLKNMIKKTNKDWQIIPEAGINTSVSDENNTPIITYKIHKRVSGERSARKPQKKQSYENTNQEKGMIVEYSQRFESIIEFGIYGNTYEEADDTREKFEEFLIDYLGHFRKQGVLELVFEEQTEDEAIEIRGQDLSKQTLRYFLRTQVVRKSTRSTIEKIETDLSLPDDYEYVKSIITKKN